MSDTKKTLYGLINQGWQLGKYFYENNPRTPLEYDKFVKMGNEMLKTQKSGTKEHRFLKRLLVAVKEYCDSEWDDEQKGEQTSLWTNQ